MLFVQSEGLRIPQAVSISEQFHSCSMPVEFSPIQCVSRVTKSKQCHEEKQEQQDGISLKSQDRKGKEIKNKGNGPSRKLNLSRTVLMSHLIFEPTRMMIMHQSTTQTPVVSVVGQVLGWNLCASSYSGLVLMTRRQQ